MNIASPIGRNMDTPLTVIFFPIVIAFVVGALPVLVPLLLVRGLSRLIGGHPHNIS